MLVDVEVEFGAIPANGKGVIFAVSDLEVYLPDHFSRLRRIQQQIVLGNIVHDAFDEEMKNYDYLPYWIREIDLDLD